MAVARLVADLPAGPAPGYRFPVPAPAPHDEPVLVPSPRLRWEVLLLPALCGLALGLSVWLDAIADPDGLGARLTGDPGWPWTTNGLVLGVFASVVLLRLPRSGAGWALAGLAGFWALDGLAQSYLRAGVGEDAAWPGSTAAHWVLARAGSALPVVIAVLLLVFPTGRLLPGAWGLAGRVSLAVMGLGVLTFLVVPGAGDPATALLPPDVDPDPTTLTWLDPVAVDVARTAMLTSLLVPFATVVHRYRLSTGLDRDRLRWLLWSVLAIVLVEVASLFYTGPGESLVLVFTIMVLPGGAICVALVAPQVVPVGDLLVRTLAWGGLAPLLLAIDLGVVALLDTVLAESLTRTQLVATVLLLTALVYAPLRSRAWSVARRLTFGDREDPYDAVAGLADRLERVEHLDDRLAAVAAAVASAFGVGYVRLEVDRIGGGTLLAEHGHRPAATRALPITYLDETVGTLELPARGLRSRLSARDERLLGDLVRQAVTSARTARLAEELQHSREQLVTAREEERRRIRRDLHDGLGPALSGVVFQLESARLLVHRDPDAAHDRLAATSAQLRDVVADVRRLVHDLRPPALDDRGLVGALEQLAERSAVPVRIRAESLPALPAAVEVAAYRIAAEAMTNVVRHARASRCEVRLCVEDGRLVVDVADDGVGVDPARGAGVGLLSLRERAAELGGHTDVGCPGLDRRGTRVVARLPVGGRG